MENLDLLEFSVPVMPSCIPVHDYFFHQNSSWPKQIYIGSWNFLVLIIDERIICFVSWNLQNHFKGKPIFPHSDGVKMKHA